MYKPRSSFEYPYRRSQKERYNTFNTCIMYPHWVIAHFLVGSSLPKPQLGTSLIPPWLLSNAMLHTLRAKHPCNSADREYSELYSQQETCKLFLHDVLAMAQTLSLQVHIIPIVPHCIDLRVCTSFCLNVRRLTSRKASSRLCVRLRALCLGQELHSSSFVYFQQIPVKGHGPTQSDRKPSQHILYRSGITAS